MRTVTVIAPSRLHFGMFSFGQTDVRQFGGVGTMVDSPGLRVALRPAEQIVARGPMAERAMEFAQSVARSGWFTRDPACEIVIEQAPREHVGLGTGTQMAMAVAAGMNTLFNRPPRSATELAQCVGRGMRSAIGLYGFEQGGLLVEAGKHETDAISPLVARAELPGEWRFVLLCPRDGSGLSGDAERAAFARLPAVPRETTEQLVAEALLGMLPAAVEGCFGAFSESLYRFGQAAGRAFSAEQGGLLAGRQLERLAGRLRASGVQGVAQTSWGPTLCALTPDETSARQLVASLTGDQKLGDLTMTVAAPNHRGASIVVQDVSGTSHQLG